MSDLYEKIIGERGTLENLVSKIPGFRGYMEMSARRDADRMIREHIAKQYEGVINRLATIEGELLNAPGGLLHMEKTKSIKTKIEVLRRRIASDTPGYSGFFATNKIGPDELANVYAFDAAMDRYAMQLTTNLDALATAAAAAEGVAEALAVLDTTIIEAGQAYDLRDEVLKGIG